MSITQISGKLAIYGWARTTIVELMRPFMFRPSWPPMGPSTFASNSRLPSWLAYLPLLMIVVFWGHCACAASITDRLAGSADVPWEISADKVTYDAASTTYHARGNVVIEKQATRLTADSVVFNHKAMTALADGHVVMIAGNDIMTGDRLELNLKQETGVVSHGTVFLNENHFYISGERIEKTGKDTYQAERAAITSCDGDNPDWVISCRSVKVTIEGYGSGTHATFKARDIPILYTPYILFPAKTKRQTGFLLPDFGLSDRKGFSWDQPLFWAINESTDATLYPHYMAKRGTKVGMEYRYALTDTSSGTIMIDSLEDRQIDDGTPENTLKWGYAGDDYDRPNTDRYWLRAKLDQELPWDARARFDLDFVSDQDYLVEFKEGRSGFNETRDYFRQLFGRDLDTYDDSTRRNQLNINRTWSQYSLNADLIWNDNVTNRRWEETDDTLQRLPRIRFDGLKQQISGSGVYWDLDSDYNYFFRIDGDRGHRMDIYPRAYLPLQWANYLSVEPSAGWRQTAWAMDSWDDNDIDRYNYRQVVDAQLDLSTEISRVFGSPTASVDRIRHTIKPKVIYKYIPDQDQSDLPEFTTTDRIDEANRITYSLTNTLTARTGRQQRPVESIDKASVTANDKSRPGRYSDSPSAIEQSGRIELARENQTDAETFDYNRFCRFFLQQSYDITEAVEDDDGPFSDIYGELDFTVSRYLRFDSDARFDIYDNRFNSYNLSTIITDHRNDQLRLRHSYETDKKESIHGTLSVKITDRLNINGEYERNLLADEDLVKGAGFIYTAQCWSFEFSHSREGTDEKYTFFINLKGIGGFGQ